MDVIDKSLETDSVCSVQLDNWVIKFCCKESSLKHHFKIDSITNRYTIGYNMHNLDSVQ